MHDDDRVSNPSANPTFETVCVERRNVLRGGAAGAALAFAGIPFAGCSTAPTGGMTDAKPASPGFKAVPATTADRVTVPE
ncbi:MAG: hypothetical protein ACREIB_13790, partial [Pseudomonadota bacterium]